jgi:transcriptional regulator of acetoin/glycerol metabolism
MLQKALILRLTQVQHYATLVHMGARQSVEVVKAIKLVKKGWSISGAARFVGIFRSTLQRALKRMRS